MRTEVTITRSFGDDGAQSATYTVAHQTLPLIEAALDMSKVPYGDIPAIRRFLRALSEWAKGNHKGIRDGGIRDGGIEMPPLVDAIDIVDALLARPQFRVKASKAAEVAGKAETKPDATPSLDELADKVFLAYVTAAKEVLGSGVL